MPVAMLYLQPRLEEYNVTLYIYDSSGKLVESKQYSGIKQVVIRSPEVRISRQLFYDEIAVVIELRNPKVELKEGGILYVLST